MRRKGKQSAPPDSEASRVRSDERLYLGLLGAKGIWRTLRSSGLSDYREYINSKIGDYRLSVPGTDFVPNIREKKEAAFVVARQSEDWATRKGIR